MEPIADTMPEARYRTTKRKGLRAEQVTARLTATLEPPIPITKSAAAKPNTSNSKTKKKPGEALVAWWPLGVGIFLCGFAPEWRETAAQVGIWAERLLFPLTLLAQHHEIGSSGPVAEIVASAALYLQMPLEGLLAKLTLDRGRGLRSAVLLLIGLHLLGAGAVWLLTYMR